jgi:ribonuclease D
MHKIYVNTPAALAELCDRLGDSEWLAVDTEFMREKTYFPRLCLLQVADEHTAGCVDPLALKDLGPLLELLYDPAKVKVLHAAHQDLEIFLQEWNRLPGPVFDTQIAAMLGGHGEQIGYAALVKRLLGTDLAKGHTRTDWCRRPLDAGQLDYAYDDVIHLGEAYLKLRGELSRLGRTAWLAQDFKRLTDPGTYRVDPNDAWQRVKGRQTLRGVQLAVLQRLAAWREQRARESNRPRRWVMGDEVLVDLSRRMPKNAHAMSRIRAFSEGTIKRWAEPVIGLIAEARNTPQAQWPSEGARRPATTPEQEAVADMLSATVRLIGAEQGVSPGAIASRSDLERLASGDTSGPLLHGWRHALAGKRLLDLAEGRIALGVEQGHPVFIERETDSTDPDS